MSTCSQPRSYLTIMVFVLDEAAIEFVTSASGLLGQGATASVRYLTSWCESCHDRIN